MKNLFLIVLFNFAGTMLLAQDTTNNNLPTNGSEKMTDTAGMAKIYLIRSTGFAGSAINLRLMVDDVILCKIKNNRYAIFYVKPGTHLFSAGSWDKSVSKSKRDGLKMPVEEGREYFLSMRIKQKFAETEIFLEEITYNTAAPQLEKYKPAKCD